MVLKFGKFKGQELSTTPKWYRDWLIKQDWFGANITQKPLHKQLNGWNGHSAKGQSVYEAIFENEKQESRKRDCLDGICSCCEGSMYYGI